MRARALCAFVLTCVLCVFVRNPLHAVTDSANYIMESCKPSDAIYEDLNIILSGALQMSRMLVSIMDWTKVSVGQSGLKKDDIDVPAVLGRAVCTHPTRPLTRPLTLYSSLSFCLTQRLFHLRSLSLSHTHSYTHALAHTLPHTALPHSLVALAVSPALSPSLTHALSRTRSVSLAVSPAVSPSLTHTHSLAHALSRTLCLTRCLSLSHTHTHSLAHSPSLSHYPSHPLSH
jgi:hypothetical protein